MPGTLVDSNVILDVLTEDSDWGDWSAEMLANAARTGTLAINPIIYAEVSARFERIEDLDEALPETTIAACRCHSKRPFSPGSAS